MTADDVAQFLQANPKFFEQYHELLATLHVPHPHGGRTISITERQILTLREKCRSLENKLAELLRFGEDNDSINSRMHRLAVAMAGTLEAPQVLSTLYRHLTEDFAIPHAALRLWGTATRIEGAEFQPVSDAVRHYASELSHPYCGPSGDVEALEWFGEAAGHVRSLCLIPLRREGETVGLLALASEEPQRFYADMGTVFLEYLGDLAAAALLRTLG